ELEDNGISAIVLKSIFEEQISMEIGSIGQDAMAHTEGYDYISQYTKQFNVEKYLNLIRDAKEKTNIPVIASINCVSDGEWVSFAEKITSAGADALELNIFLLPGDFKKEADTIEKSYFDIIKAVSDQTNIPVSVKISSYFTALANTIFRISLSGVSGIVLFNRFFQPDINIETMEVIAADIYSTRRENSHPLRWIGMLSDNVKCDLVASTGVHEGEDVLKNILVGAKAVQVVSSIYKNGPSHIKKMLDDLNIMMDKKSFSSISDITGKLSQKNIENPEIFERVQFMKYYANS
ncbi:MAG: dihydroorotate dehydrogenase-like protein, partial [Candidatus Aminicenantes bacterium]|nr:dihydroorotate dehydrogenase-like protein [Candidatus Aminicenantes bacterium]